MIIRKIATILVLLVLAFTPACGSIPVIDELEPEENPELNLPPGNSLPAGGMASPNDPTPPGALPGNPTVGGPGGPLKPVKFVNVGTEPYTVSAWTYTPPGGAETSAGLDPSTVAFPGGNPSSYLSLPLGTYTWCFWWELGDVNNDGLIEYSHALDGRPVLLDGSDNDTLEFAETVILGAPTIAGDIPGKCDATAVTQAPPRARLEDGDLLLSDNGGGGAEGMFGGDYMLFGYAGGQAVLTAKGNNLILPAMYNQLLPADFSLEVDMTAFNAGGEGQYQVIFRSDDVAGGLASYNIISLLPGSRSVEFGVWSDGWKVSAASVISDQSILMIAPLRLRLEAKGPEYVIFINGKFAAGFVDGSIISGGILRPLPGDGQRTGVIQFR